MTPAERYRRSLVAAGKSPEEVRAAVKQARARFDGQGAAPAKLHAWLSGLSAAEQDEVVGPAKGKLFRSGKLTKTRELVAQAHRPIKPEDL